MVKHGHKLDAEERKKHELTWLTMAKEHVKPWSNMVRNRGNIRLERKTCTNMVEHGPEMI